VSNDSKRCVAHCCQLALQHVGKEADATKVWVANWLGLAGSMKNKMSLDQRVAVNSEVSGKTT